MYMVHDVLCIQKVNYCTMYCTCTYVYVHILLNPQTLASGDRVDCPLSIENTMWGNTVLASGGYLRW